MNIYKWFFCGIAIHVILQAPAVADNLYVPNDYPTIQMAIDAATQNDVIYISQGSYAGYTVHNKLNLIAQPGTTVTSRVWITEIGSSLSGFSFHGGVTAFEPFTMTNCDFFIKGLYISGAYAPPPTISHTSFVGIAGKGVSLDYADAVLDECHFQDVLQHSISLSDICQVWVTSSVFVDNGPFDGSECASIDLEGCEFQNSPIKALAHTFRADSCRFSNNGPEALWLWSTYCFEPTGPGRVEGCDFVDNQIAIWFDDDFETQYAVGSSSFCRNEQDIVGIYEDLGGNSHCPCPADTNGDGTLSPADFTAWIDAFNSEATECDQNGDGLCTPADFTAWIANYNAGC